MNVLIRKNKHSSDLYDISTPEREAAAYLVVFREMEEEGCYGDLSDEPEQGTEKQVELYQKASKGDAAAAKELLQYRSNEGYEYEGMEEVDVIDPLKA